jgi:methyl-accepting chemotaxis protein
MSIRWKLFIPIASAILVFTLVLIILISTTVTRDVLEQNEQFASTYVDTIYSQISSFVADSNSRRELLLQETRRRLGEIVESAHGMLEGLHGLEQRGLLSRDRAQEIAVQNLNSMWFGRDGYLWADDLEYINVALPPNPAVVGTSRYDLQDQTGQYIVRYFVDESRRSGESWLEYYFPKPGEEEPSPKLGYTKLFEPWGWVLGTGEYIDNIEDVIADFEAQSLGALNESLYSGTTDRSDYPFILDADGNFIAYIRQELIGTSPTLLDTETGEDLIAKFLASPEGRISYYYPKPGDPDGSYEKIGYIRRLRERDWLVVYTYYPDEILSDVRRFRTLLIVLGVVGLVFQGGLLIILLSMIQKVLRRTTGSMQTIAEGSGDLTFRLPVSTRDEIGQLSEAFNQMMGKLQTMVLTLRDSARESEGIGQELSSSSEEISTAVVQMTATGQSISEKSSTLAREAVSADENVQDIIESMKAMGNVSQDESAAVEQSSAAVEQMVASIQNITRISQERAELIRGLSERASAGHREMEQTRTDVQSIAESAGAIQQVLKVIQDISQRINLLAMNAAIEAAHAGDAGRGFAVVAEEIRKLAESTAGNSAQIAGSVKEIVEKIDAATARSDETARSISRIAEQSGESARAMEEIFQALNEVNQGTVQITEALEHLVGSSTMVRDASMDVIEKSGGAREALERVSNLSHQNDQGNQEIANAMREVSLAIQQIRDLGVRNIDNLKTISREIDRFTVDEDGGASPAPTDDGDSQGMSVIQ